MQLHFCDRQTSGFSVDVNGLIMDFANHYELHPS